MSVPHLPYLTFKTASLSCPACGWTGAGAETVLGESYDTFSERMCPKCPDELVALAIFPLIGEDPQYARAAERARLSRPPLDPEAEEATWKEHVRSRPGATPAEIERDLDDTAAFQAWLSHRLATKHICDVALTWGLLPPDEREVPYAERDVAGAEEA